MRSNLWDLTSIQKVSLCCIYILTNFSSRVNIFFRYKRIFFYKILLQTSLPWYNLSKSYITNLPVFYNIESLFLVHFWNLHNSFQKKIVNFIVTDDNKKSTNPLFIGLVDCIFLSWYYSISQILMWFVFIFDCFLYF